MCVGDRSSRFSGNFWCLIFFLVTKMHKKLVQCIRLYILTHSSFHGMRAAVHVPALMLGSDAHAHCRMHAERSAHTPIKNPTTSLVSWLMTGSLAVNVKGCAMLGQDFLKPGRGTSQASLYTST